MGLIDRFASRDEESPGADIVALPSAAVTTTATPQPYSADRPLVASAERINLRKKGGVNALLDRPYKEWQRDAWMYYDAIAEIKYAFTLLGAVMSRIRLYPAIILDPDAPPQSTTIIKRREAGQSDDETSEDTLKDMVRPEEITDEVMKYMETLVKDLGSGNGGIPGLQRAYALNMAVAGECYLCQIDGRWTVRSSEEVIIRETDSKPVLRTMRTLSNRVTGSNSDRELPTNTYIGRIWRSHPRYSSEPDSSMLGLLEMCDELLTLQRMIRAIARSKMNAGLLLVDDSVTVSSQPLGETAEEDEESVDMFDQELLQAIVSTVGDESSAFTVSPMVARVSGGESGVDNKIKYVQFNREADRQLVERADRALERILQGIDVPKDIVTGLANVKYSNAVQIDEGLYKSHVEPAELLLVDSLTAIYFRQALKAKFPDLSEDALSKCVIWYDPTEVVTKPDPAHAAEKLYENYEISGDAFRRAFGFADTDAPDEDEVANRLAIEKATLPPEIVSALVKHLLPSVFKEQQQAAVDKSGMPESARQMLYPDESGDTKFGEAIEPPEPSDTPMPAQNPVDMPGGSENPL